jgi:hypothetical protein
MASIALCFAFMLVIGTATAYPMHKEGATNQQDLVEAIRYFWNERIGKDQRAEAAMDLWSKEAEKDHQNDVYATRDDREEGDKDENEDENKDEDKDENKGKDKGEKNLKDQDKDEGSSRARNRVTDHEERDGNKNSVEVESGTIEKDQEDRIKAMLSDLLQHG